MATLDDLSTALRNADAAGDADAARALAAEITKLRAVDTSGDLAKSAAIAVPEGLINAAGAPGDLSEYGARGIDWATRKIGGLLGVDVKPRPDQPFRGGSGDIKGAIEGVTGKFYESKTPEGKILRSAVSTATNPISYVGPGGLALKAAQAGLAGAGSEAAGQMAEGTGYETPARIAGAIAAPSALNVASRVVQPIRSSAAQQRMVKTLEDEGVTAMTAGQRTNNTALKYGEDILGNAPLAGQKANRIQEEGTAQLARAAAQKADETGFMTDIGPKALAKNYDRLNNNLDGIAASTTVNMDRQFGSELAHIARKYIGTVGPVKRGGWNPEVKVQMENILAAARGSRTLPGTTYKEVRRHLTGLRDGAKGAHATAFQEIRNALDGAFARSVSPADQALFQRSLREWGAQKDLSRAVTSARAIKVPEGHLDANSLRQTAITNNRTGHARGEGPFYDLSEAAARVMAPLPNSGTAQRYGILSAVSALGGAGGSLLGPGGLVAGLGLPAALGKALMAKPTQAYLGGSIPGQRAVGEALRGPERNRMLARLLRAQAAQSSAAQQ
jgi:hypothetical protein